MSVLSVYDATRGYLYHNQGLRNDLDFWSLYSGITGHASWTTHADFALTKNGYTGSLNDKLIKWASDLTGHTDWTFNDNVLYFFKSMPSGLTFFKNYASIPAQTASNSTLLNANLSVGSGVATFTSTDGNFTITSSGYQSTTANDEVLKYLIAGNRTAAQETIIIKFTPTGNFANDGNTRQILSNDTPRNRYISKLSDKANTSFAPNAGDSSSSYTQSSTTLLDGVSYVVIGICQQTTSPYVQLYINDTREATDTDNFTTNLWGTYFYIGSGNNGTNQLNGYVAKVLKFNRALSASEVSIVYNLIK